MAPQGQRDQSVDEGAVAILDGSGRGKLQVFEVVHEPGDDDNGLRSGLEWPHATVDAVTERHVWVGFAGDVESVGVDEAPWVVVGGQQ